MLIDKRCTIGKLTDFGLVTKKQKQIDRYCFNSSPKPFSLDQKGKDASIHIGNDGSRSTLRWHSALQVTVGVLRSIPTFIKYLGEVSAPEMLQRKGASYPSDVWSLGVIAWYRLIIIIMFFILLLT